MRDYAREKIGEKIGDHYEVAFASAVGRSHIFWLLQNAGFWLMLFQKVPFESITKHLFIFFKKPLIALKAVKVLFKKQCQTHPQCSLHLNNSNFVKCG